MRGEEASFDSFTNPEERMDLLAEAVVDGETEFSDTMEIGYGSGVSFVGVLVDTTGEARMWGEYR